MIQPLSSRRRLWIDAASAVSLLASSLREEDGLLNKRPRPIFNPRQDGPYPPLSLVLRPLSPVQVAVGWKSKARDYQEPGPSEIDPTFATAAGARDNGEVARYLPCS